MNYIILSYNMLMSQVRQKPIMKTFCDSNWDKNRVSPTWNRVNNAIITVSVDL